MIHGRTIGDGLRLVWDDDTTLDMIDYMLDNGVVDIFIDHGVDKLGIVPDVLSLLALYKLIGTHRGDSEVEVEDVNDRNNIDTEVEVDPTYSVRIDYLSGSEDEEIIGGKSKF